MATQSATPTFPIVVYNIKWRVPPNTAFIVVNSADDLATIDTSRYKPLPCARSAWFPCTTSSMIFVSRCDCLFGWAAPRPEWACKVVQ